MLPTFGNNDFQFHYQVPNITLRDAFYTEIMNDWFQNIAFNAKNVNYELIKTTFKSGGYYRVNLPGSRISVLALNTICFSNKDINSNQGGQQEMQLQWLEEQLSSAESTRKFIITNHIYFGL